MRKQSIPVPSSVGVGTRLIHVYTFMHTPSHTYPPHTHTHTLTIHTPSQSTHPHTHGYSSVSIVTVVPLRAVHWYQPLEARPNTLTLHTHTLTLHPHTTHTLTIHTHTHSRIFLCVYSDSGSPESTTLVPTIRGTSQHLYHLPFLQQWPACTRNKIIVHQELGLNYCMERERERDTNILY